MREISDDQYFLILDEINLFPELSPNPVQMIEQIMNGLLLTAHDNVQEGLNRVLNLEHTCKSIIGADIFLLLETIKPILENYGILIARGLEVKAMYPRYENKKKYFWDVGKQAAMNLEFSLAKKLSFDGTQIKFESTYIDWVCEILESQRETSKYNSNDKLIYHIIEPQATVKHVETREIIEKETENYAEEFRKIIIKDNGSK